MSTFPIPDWLRIPAQARYFGMHALTDPDYQVEFRLPDGTIHWKANKGPQTYALYAPFQEVLVGGRRGGGKLQPLDSMVCTPKGFVRMGSLKVGDSVTDPTTGGATKVIAVHPHPEMDIWRITFDDGASLEVGKEHLWAYRVSNRQRPGTKKSSERAFAKDVLGSQRKTQKWDRYRVGSTEEVMREFEAGEKVRIPLTEPVIFTKRVHGGPMPPYLVGLLLGDGHLATSTITTADPEIVDYIQANGFGNGCCKEGNAASGYCAVGPAKKRILTYFRNHGMIHHRSWEKSIPAHLKCGLLSERLDVLRGLMDTDGYVDERGRVYFDSTSEQLVRDVQFIVRSLGGKAKIRNRQTTFTGADGNKKNGRPSFQLRIWHPKTSCLFNLSRKRARCTDSWNGGLELSRELTKIEYVGKKEAQCITVSSPYGLYVGEDFVVTHNSIWLLARPVMGDLSLPIDDPARGTYLNDPDFRGLFLREEYQSLVEFIEQAEAFYKPFGGVAKGDPKFIEFPSKARIYFNHLQDESAFNKYKGWNLTFIGIEELTQIRTLKQYLKLLGSLRSVERRRTVRGEDGKSVQKTFPPLRTQIASTTNPDGVGSQWVQDRFVFVPDEKGNDIPWGVPMYDTIADSWRIFIPFPIEGNPYLAPDSAAGRRYHSMLMSQDETTRKQWMEGDWKAGSSLFFSEYRPNGPQGEEEKDKFPWAKHRVESAPLKPWWYRFGSGDQGYDHPAAFHKFCRNESDGRLHVYDELQVRRIGAFELGAIVAKWWLPELMGLKSSSGEAQIVIHIGSDMFRKTSDERTLAEQMAAGVREVLGPYGAILMKYDEVERELMVRDPKRAQAIFRERMKQAEGHMALALKPCWPDRIAAWSYMRDMLRFRPAILNLQTAEERDEYLRDVLKNEGRAMYELQAEKLRTLKPEILPKLQIWKVCKELDRCLRAAQRDNRGDGDPSRKSNREDVLKMNADSEGLGGDDALESARNGCFAFKEIETTMPLFAYVQDRVEEIQKEYEENFGERLTDPTRLMMVHQAQAALYTKQNTAKSGSFSLPSNRNIRNRGGVQ